MTSLDDETDENLMARIQNADHQAFAILVKRHTNMFYTAAYRSIGHKNEAEDIVQEAFLKLWSKPHIWDSKKGVKFTTWFYKVVTNLALDKGRRQKRMVTADYLEEWEDDSERQQQVLEDKQQQADLEAAIHALPEKQKTALNLCFYEELSNKEAAEIMGVGVKALESLLMRAKAKLKDQLIRNGRMT